MKNLVFRKGLLLIVCISLFSLGMNAQENKQEQEIKMFQPIESLQKELGLSADQVTKLQAIDEDYATRYVNAAFSDREKILDERHEAYRKVLTQEQYKKYAADNHMNSEKIDLKEDAKQVGSDIKKTSENVKNEAKKDGEGVAKKTSDAVKDAGEDISKDVKKDAKGIKKETESTWDGIKEGTKEAWDDVKKETKETWDKATNKADKAKDKAAKEVGKAKDKTKEEVDKTKDKVKKETK